MDSEIYKTYYRMEREHWWFHGRTEILLSLLRTYFPNLNQAKVLDIGTGTGGLLEVFAKEGISITGHDASEEGVALIRQNGGRAELKKLPEDYQDAAPEYDIVLLLDVLEHVEDDREGLKAALRMLKPGGILLCTVPANKSMWGPYDEFSHHFRRYEYPEFEALMNSAMIPVRKISFFCTLLFPIIFTARMFEKTFLVRKAYRPYFVPGIFNKFLYQIFRLEKGILARGTMPFGSSLLGILQK